MQVFQIYNDEVKDLLSSKEFLLNKPKNDKLKFDCRKDNNSKQGCKLKSDSNGNQQVEGGTSVAVDTPEDCMWFVTQALENLINRSSQMNHYSTRGHCCFSFKLNEGNHESYFTFIDLAGSEKFNKQEINSIGSKECKKINNSLFVLRKVISILSYNSTIVEKKDKEEVPKSTPSKLNGKDFRS